MRKVKEECSKVRAAMDWFTLNNYLKRQWVQKKSWRQYKSKTSFFDKLVY